MHEKFYGEVKKKDERVEVHKRINVSGSIMN